jgi:KaiC/GvpD/RAD55 family RecA-like ATPase
MADPSIPEVHVALVDHHSNIRTLREIVVPQTFFDRIKLGVPVIDELFGGADWPGFMKGSTFLFTGAPGAGKSTAALQFADLLQKNAGRNVLYNVGEESEVMVKMRADRLGISGEFGISCIEDVDDLIKACVDLGVEVLFQDSLQSLRGKSVENIGRDARLKLVVKRLTKAAKDHGILVFILGHLTKSGDSAGPNELVHDVDARAHIRLDPKTQAREFILTKNRFGPAGIGYEVNLSATGLDFAASAMQPEGEGESAQAQAGSSSKASDRRAEADRVIKEALLRGEKVSRACHARLGVDCSDGFWATRVEKVAQELRATGKNMQKGNVDGKSHNWMEV